jgi:type VI secretion system protein ImpM
MLGDFASRRMNDAMARRLDLWLASLVHAQQNRHGAQWHRQFLNTPVWRFAWSPGVLDTQWWFGLLIPSVDAARRLFPWVALVPGTRTPVGPGEDAAALTWYAAAQEAANTAFQPRATLADLEAALAALPAWPTADSRGGIGQDALVANATSPGSSLWWMAPPFAPVPTRRCSGLPTPQVWLAWNER